MLAADTDLQRGTRLPSPLRRHLHQLSDPFAIQYRKRILLDDSIRQIRRQNLVHVVTREAPRRLRQIVRAERKEFSLLRDLIGDQSRTRQLDHRAHQVFHFLTLLCKHFLRHAVHNRRLVRHFVHRRHQRDHHLGKHFDPRLSPP